MKLNISRKTVLTAVMALVVAGMFTAAIFMIVRIAGEIKRGKERPDEAVPIIVTASADTSSAPAETESKPEKEETDPTKNLQPLKEKIMDKLLNADGKWSVYVKHLGTGEEIVINDCEMYAASLIKLYCIAAIQQAVEDGNLTQEEVREDEKQMIMYSDNFAFDALVELLPDGYISDWCIKNNYWDTQQTHELSNDWAYQVRRTGIEDNMTSPKDCGKFLESVYRGECISEESSKWILKLLKKQKTVTKIPAGLPEGVKFANKTGETDDFNHDAAIVYSKGGDYILVVMGEIEGYAYTCDSYIIDISKMVYKYFNP